MIDYGNPPSADEIEVSLFGPGYGEAIALHLGGGTWVLIDSCVDPDANEPASAIYLDRIGILSNQVHTIVATHWHDDHVRGIAKLSEKYSSAEFVVSSIFNQKEASALLSTFSGESSAGLARGTKELFSVLQRRSYVSPAHHKSIVVQESINGRPVLITALSPVQAAVTQSIAHLAQFLPRKHEPINHAPQEIRPNYGSLALHIDLGDDAILLGADLEDDSKFGWTAVIADQWSGKRRPATAYKIAHHGSYTGDCPQIWSTLLMPEPVACLTPFTLGRLRLPTDADKSRVKSKTPNAYTSSGASRSPKMGSYQLKRLGDICKDVRLVEAAFGAIRLRKKVMDKSWSVELFGAAQLI